jgi:hypothetical protein
VLPVGVHPEEAEEPRGRRREWNGRTRIGMYYRRQWKGRRKESGHPNGPRETSDVQEEG